MNQKVAEYKDYKIIDADNLTQEESAEVLRIKDSLNINDSNAIITFGAQAQRKTSNFVDSLMESIKTKNLNEAGAILNNLMIEIKSFDTKAGEPKNIISKLFSSAEKRIERLRGSYSSIEKNLTSIIDSLEKHRHQLIQSNAMLDKLYEKSVGNINEIRLYTIAGEQKLQEIDTQDLPALQAGANGADGQIGAQRYKDMIDARERLDKKIHDLKLTRAVYIQTLPQIRLQQASNNVLVDKIHSSIVNSIPLWKTQLAIALGLAHTTNALKAQKAVSDTTNELLRKNSELLKTTTIETAKENERSIIDIETIKKANDDIINTIKQVVQIQQEGRDKRRQAEEELQRIESELKNNIINAFNNKSISE